MPSTLVRLAVYHVGDIELTDAGGRFSWHTDLEFDVPGARAFLTAERQNSPMKVTKGPAWGIHCGTGSAGRGVAIRSL